MLFCNLFIKRPSYHIDTVPNIVPHNVIHRMVRSQTVFIKIFSGSFGLWLLKNKKKTSSNTSHLRLNCYHKITKNTHTEMIGLTNENIQCGLKKLHTMNGTWFVHHISVSKN